MKKLILLLAFVGITANASIFDDIAKVVTMPITLPVKVIASKI